MGQSLAMVDVTYSVRDDRQVDAHIGPEWPVLDHALGDSISSLPPAGWPYVTRRSARVSHCLNASTDRVQMKSHG